MSSLMKNHATATKHECGEEKDYVNDPQGEAYKQAIDEEDMRDDDGYYVNDDLFPEEYQVTGGNAAAALVTVKKTDNNRVDDRSN